MHTLLTRGKAIMLVVVLLICYLKFDDLGKAPFELGDGVSTQIPGIPDLSAAPSSELHSPELPLKAPEPDHSRLASQSEPKEAPKEPQKDTSRPTPAAESKDGKFYWSTIKQEHPVSSFLLVPSSVPKS